MTLPLVPARSRLAGLVFLTLLGLTPGVPAFAQIPREFIYIGNQLVVYQASFQDVPPGSGEYAFVNRLANLGITAGCSGLNYCPGVSVSRESMAYFVLRAKEGPTYVPVPCGERPQMFVDVPATNPFCPWIEDLAARGVVAGCGGGYFCPTDPVKREQMSIYLLRTLDPNLNPPACGTPMFQDVPASSPFCRWIEELVRRGIATGCAANPPLYCPTSDVTRGSMAVFLVTTFSLGL